VKQARNTTINTDSVNQHSTDTLKTTCKPKLLDHFREALRFRHYSSRTDQAYCHWVRRFIFFHMVRYPLEIAEPEINAFLTHLAVKEKEVKAVLVNLSGDEWPMASLMYGAGLRLMECLRLRVYDMDFEWNEITVRDGKGAKGRIAMLPVSLKLLFQKHPFICDSFTGR
jgi:integrase